TATLGAPQTLCIISPFPTSTLVTFSRSALVCCAHSKTSPTTTPSNPPFTEEKSSIPSTSRPRSVNSSPVFSASQGRLINCFNQLYEIVISVKFYIEGKDSISFKVVS